MASKVDPSQSPMCNPEVSAKVIETRNNNPNWKANHAAAMVAFNKSRANTYEAFSPEGELISIENVNELCDELGIESAGFYAMLRGEVVQCFGWSLCGPEEVSRRLEALNTARVAKTSATNKANLAQISWLVSPENELWKVKGLNAFCVEFGLSRGNLAAVIRGDRARCKGWTRGEPAAEGEEYIYWDCTENS